MITMELNKNNKIYAIILAAGKGKRMQSDKLKVMHDLGGKPLIDYVVTSVEKSIVNNKPVVVVNNNDSSVQDYLGDRAVYIIQKEQLGTGHAVKICEDLLSDKAEHIVVLYGDLPLVSPQSINKLIENKIENKSILSLATTTVPNFNDQYIPFFTFARIERNEDGGIKRIVEKKDCTEPQLNIFEVNTGYYCFSASWLWDHLKELKKNNAQEEYYLTDLIALAINNKEKVSSIDVLPREALGITTKEDLEIVHKYI